MKFQNILYLDHNATTPVAREAQQAMLACMEAHFANTASATHTLGLRANIEAGLCRQKVASLLQVPADSVYFTSGATESNNMVLKGVAQHFLSSKENVHIVASAVEHKCVLDVCRHLQRHHAVEVSFIPVDGRGVVDLDALRSALRPHTRLVSVMAANNETGTLQPIREAAAIARQHGALFHTDAAQWIGKLHFPAPEVQADFITFSAHKFYGPKGIGGLFCADRRILGSQPLIHGGGQEEGIRSGTLNLPAIAGMAAAADLARTHLPEEAARQYRLKQDFIDALMQAVPGVQINGCRQESLPNTINFSVPQVKASTLLKCLKHRLALSSGSACNSSDQRPSHVLEAMGYDDDRMQRSIRLSFGRDTTAEDLREAAALIATSCRPVCAA